MGPGNLVVECPDPHGEKDAYEGGGVRGPCNVPRGGCLLQKFSAGLLIYNFKFRSGFQPRSGIREVVESSLTSFAMLIFVVFFRDIVATLSGQCVIVNNYSQYVKTRRDHVSIVGIT